MNGLEDQLALAVRSATCWQWDGFQTTVNPLENFLQYDVCGGAEYLLFVGDETNGYFDSDQDGILDADEFGYGTDPNLCDSDGDGLSDGFEVAVSGTDPSLCDTSGNGCNDAQEYGGGCTPTCDEDLSGDGTVGTTDILQLLGAFGPCPD